VKHHEIEITAINTLLKRFLSRENRVRKRIARVTKPVADWVSSHDVTVLATVRLSETHRRV